MFIIIIILKRKNKTFAFLTSQSLIEKLDLVFLIFLTDFVFLYVLFSFACLFVFFFVGAVSIIRDNVDCQSSFSVVISKVRLSEQLIGT